MSLAICYPALIALLSFGAFFRPSQCLSSGISSILPSFASLRLVVLTSDLTSLSLGVTCYCSVRFPLCVLSVGVILHAPVSGVPYFTDFAFAFSHCEGKASRFAENTVILFAAQKGAATFHTFSSNASWLKSGYSALFP